MNTLTHATPEDIMALLDGELPPSEAQAITAHIAHCDECGSIVEQFRATSAALAQWLVPAAPQTIEPPTTAPAAYRSASQPGPFLRHWKAWALGSATVAAIAIFAVVQGLPRPEHTALSLKTATEPAAAIMASDSLSEPLAERYTYAPPPSPAKVSKTSGLISASTQTFAPPPPPPGGGGANQRTAQPPMIARTVSLAVLVHNVDTARTTLDAILARHHGYSAQLTASTAENSARTLQASLCIPAPELAVALAELKTLGRVQNETQTGEEVTQQHADLAARLTNARESETRLRAILQQRTGKVSDVLEVEEEITRIRGQIETMQAEQQTLDHRVDFATADLQLSEQFKAPLDAPAAAVSTRIRNAFVAGYHTAAESLLGFVLFVEECAPTLLVWLALLGVPIGLALRRFRRQRLQ